MADSSGAVLLTGHEIETAAVTHPGDPDPPLVGRATYEAKRAHADARGLRSLARDLREQGEERNAAAVEAEAVKLQARSDALLDVGHSASLAVGALMQASVLQALMLHVRRDRGQLLGLDTRDPESVTVGQLAVMLRPHNGSAGQAFEFVVADTLNFGRPEMVRERVREAAAAIGVPIANPAAVVVGLEKVSDPDTFTDVLAPVLDGKSLRTTGPGRPPQAMNAIRRYLGGGTGVDYGRGELAAADLLIYDRDGSNALTASLKLGGGWKARWDRMQHPRLLITTDSQVRYYARHAPKGVVVVGVFDDEWTEQFSAVFNSVVRSLARIDKGQPAKSLRLSGLRADQTVAETVHELQARAGKLAQRAGLHIDAEDPTILSTTVDALLPNDTPATIQGLDKQALVTPAHQFYTPRDSGLLVVGQD